MRLTRASCLLGLSLLLVLPACSGRRADGPAAQLTFGVAMAQRGLWEEALFRFRRASLLDPTNPRVFNNLAVASEAAGKFDEALGYYQKALQLDPGNRELKANYSRFSEFYQSLKAKPKAEGEPAPEASPPVNPPPAGAKRDGGGRRPL